MLQGLWKDFLDMTPKTQEVKGKLGTCTDIKLKGCRAKETVTSVQRQPQTGGKQAPTPENLNTHYPKGKKVNNGQHTETDISQKKTLR